MQCEVGCNAAWQTWTGCTFQPGNSSGNAAQPFGWAASIAAWPTILAHLAGLLSQRAHLRLRRIAMQPHDFGQLAGLQQRSRMVERVRGRLHAAREFLKSLAGLIEAFFRHRSHFLRNLQPPFFTHRPAPVAPSRARELWSPLAAPAPPLAIRSSRIKVIAASACSPGCRAVDLPSCAGDTNGPLRLSSSGRRYRAPSRAGAEPHRVISAR